MCAISLTAWATVRGAEISRIAIAAGLAVRTSSTTKSKEPNPTLTHTRSSSIISNTSDSSSLDVSARRRSKPSSKALAEDEAVEKDGDFIPSEALAPTVFGEEEEEEDLEAGAINWVMFAVGGLGVPGIWVAWSRV
jgi:hypothetical protein